MGGLFSSALVMLRAENHEQIMVNQQLNSGAGCRLNVWHHIWKRRRYHSRRTDRVGAGQGLDRLTRICEGIPRPCEGVTGVESGAVAGESTSLKWEAQLLKVG